MKEEYRFLIKRCNFLSLSDSMYSSFAFSYFYLTETV